MISRRSQNAPSVGTEKHRQTLETFSTSSGAASTIASPDSRAYSETPESKEKKIKKKNDRIKSESDILMDPYRNFGTADIELAIHKSCTCGNQMHISSFDPKIPLMTEPGVESGSYNEALTCARSLCGEWITLLDRSDSLDSQLKHVGINIIKRTVMNRLAVPLTLTVEKHNKVLHVQIHTPLGIRHMVCDLTGKPFTDDDPDAGQWHGTAKMVNYSIPWFCGGKAVRALQQVRTNVKSGFSIETRCVLPDPEFGRIMLFNFTMISNARPAVRMFADRILKLKK